MSSSNPFRRKINADPQRSIPPNLDPAGTGITQPLSINTGAKAGKHVRIASPPDTAISPASYPSSPEFARLTPSPQQTIIPYTFNATSQTPANDAFGPPDSSGDDEENQGASEALKNTRLNIASTRVPSAEAPNKPEDAVQTTLSRFASRTKDGSTVATQFAAEVPKQDSKRQTMDVDAFTRLLLKGGSTQGTSGSPTVANSGPLNTLSESSSTADSASISRQSIFEPVLPIASESPRTSQELDEAETVVARRAVTSVEVTQGTPKTQSKPPPAPRPRHGKPLKQTQAATVGAAVQSPQIASTSSTSPEPRSPESDLNKPLPPPPASLSASESSRRSSAASIVGTDASQQIKRPPTPPLSRRRSQGPSKPPLSRSSPSLQSISGTSPSLSSSSSLSQASKPPPPPPSRRISQRLTQTTNTSTLPYTSEETDSIDLSNPILPQLSRTTSTATRTSVLSFENGAPLPPPPRRKHRGSSNASQKPNFGTTSAATAAGSGRNSTEIQRPDLEITRKISAGSGRDILQDLATLQAEVDALRKQSLREE
jgi:hypothetical protein